MSKLPTEHNPTDQVQQMVGAVIGDMGDIGAEIKKSYVDSILYGVGFLSIDKDLNLKRISAKEAFEKAKFIEAHSMPEGQVSGD